MDKLLSVHERKATKQPKSKKKPVKVVYISNPMKVKTTASKFRALVQELTGRDATVPDPSKYSEIDGVDQTVVGEDEIIKAVDHDLETPVQRMEPGAGDCQVPSYRPDLAFEPYDEVFMPQMLENFTGLLSSNSFYEYAHVDAL
ncbi:hypothetical protein NMG60_11003521 [Bertholletia excelsa]